MSEVNLKNYMEDCVQEMIPTVLKGMDMCTCDHCKMDIMAYALNNLPPKYIVTRKGQLYTKLEAMHSQFDADIVTAVTTGAKLVSENPRHS